jgi:manganese/iron transport system permease protein
MPSPLPVTPSSSRRHDPAHDVTRLLFDPFSLPFMQRALIELLLLGLLGGVVGVYVVLRKLAFVGDALSHTVFPGVVVAGLLGQSLALGALVAGVLTAVLLTLLSAHRHISEDSALAVLLTGFFAVGVVLVSRQRGYTADLTAYLFGRVLYVDAAQIVETSVVAVVVLGLLGAVHKELLLRAFDPTGAAASGYRIVRLDLLLNLVLMLVVVAAVQAVGTVLVIALILVPAATARLLSDRLPVILGMSVVLGMLGGYLGLVGSYEASVYHGARLASGASVVVVLVAAYLLALGASGLRGVVLTRRISAERVPA